MTTTKPQSEPWDREPDPCWSCGGDAEARDDIHVRCIDTKGVNCEVMGHWFTRKTWNTRLSPAGVPPVVDRQVVAKALLDAVDAFCGQFETLGERFRKQLRNTVRATIRNVPAATAAPQQPDAETFVRQWVSTLQDESHVTDEDVEDLVFRVIAYTNRAAAPVEQKIDEATMEWALRELADGWIQNNEREGPHGFYQNARRVLNAIVN